MCNWSSHEYERRLSADPTRSFFQALRDLFRRDPRPQIETEVIALPAEATAIRVSDPITDRAKAA
jgi:hypothetical protein